MTAKFIRDLFTEPDGIKWSLSRVTSAAMVFAPIVWVTFVVFKTRIIPDLTSPALFATGGAVHGGLGKWSEIVRAKLNLQNGTNSVPEPDQPKG
jgi:hypothetical protein